MREEVSDNRDEGETYLGKLREDKVNPERPRRDQRLCKIGRAFKLNGGGIRTTKKILVIITTGRETYPEPSRSGNRDGDREKTRPVKENVSFDRHKEKTYLEVSRLGNRDSGGPWKSQELRGKMGTHRAYKPDGKLRNKNAKTRKKTNETYREMVGRHKKKIRSGGPGEGREPRPRTKLNWACRPTSGRNKNKVLPVCRYAMRLAEPQYGWQSRNTIGDAAVRLTLFLAAATKTDQSGTSQSATHRKLKFCQCVTNNVSCYSN